MTKYTFKSCHGGFALFKDGTYVERISEDGIISNRPLEDGEYEKFMGWFRNREKHLMRSLEQTVEIETDEP